MTDAKDLPKVTQADQQAAWESVAFIPAGEVRDARFRGYLDGLVAERRRDAAVREHLAAPMPCDHALRHWRPLEGTAAGAILFDRDPAQHGCCEVCRAAGAMRGAAAQRCREVAIERLKHRDKVGASIADECNRGILALPAP